jgi:predicted NBD/HSP70 family sugar kinase
MKKATHQQTRSHNTRLVLKTIYDHPSISRADVARQTGLTRASVSSIAAELINSGLVAEVGQGRSAGGKPPTLLSVVDDSRYLIGIDAANGEVRGATLDLRGNPQLRLSLPLGEGRGKAALAQVSELLDQILSHTDRNRLLGIGVGVPGLIDSANRAVLQSVALGWQQLPLGDILEDRYQLPVCIANDCNAATMAEYSFGSSRHIKNLVVIKVGRGTGAGLMINRRLHYGDGYGAGEIGHLVVVEGGELCECGRRGCLETLASSRAIVRRARVIAGNHPDSLLWQFAGNTEQINLDVVLKALQAGEERLYPVVGEAGRYLGLVAANLVGFLNIGRIVLAGSVSRFGQPLVEAVAREVNQRSLPGLAGETSVVITDLGTDIVVLGAGALLLARELGVV